MKKAAVAVALLAAAWLFIRPRTVPCPQCEGRGAPPHWIGGYQFARVCGTCGVSSTPDLPFAPGGEEGSLFPEPEIDPELREGL